MQLINYGMSVRVTSIILLSNYIKLYYIIWYVWIIKSKFHLFNTSFKKIYQHNLIIIFLNEVDGSLLKCNLNFLLNNSIFYKLAQILLLKNSEPVYKI